MRAVPSVSSLRRALEVRSYLLFERSNAFEELIVYKDWNTGTEVHFSIVETGNPTNARTNWRALGLTPWAWRYVSLRDGGWLPHFTFVLNRKGELRVTAQDKDGKSLRFPPKTRSEKINYSEFFVRWETPGVTFTPRFCVPQYSVRRPQTPFLPTTERPDRIFALGSTSLLFYPRDVRRRGEVQVEPVTGHTDADLAKQRRRRYSSTRHLRSDTSKGSEYVVGSSATGHEISSIDGEYAIAITIEDLQRSAAYNFTFTSTEVEEIIFDGNEVRKANWDEIELYVHHSPNVKVTAWARARAWRLKATFRVYEQNQAFVAALGEPLPAASKFRPLHATTSGASLLYLIGSLALLVIPGGWVVGLVLSVGEMAYTYSTGEDFFGNVVSPPEFAAMGLLGLVGAVSDVRGAVRAVSGATRALTEDASDAFRLAFRQFADEYETAVRGSIEAVEQAGSQPVVKVIASMSRTEQQVLSDLGRADLDPAEYLRRAGQLLSDQLSAVKSSRPQEFQLIVAETLEGLLTPDGRTLADDYLRAAYDAYLRNPRTKRPLEPITWLRRSRSAQVVRYMTAVFGDDYKSVIGIAQKVKGGQHVVVASESNIHEVFEFFDLAFESGLRPYAQLDALRKQSRFDPIRGLLRNCFEFEHPVELRFARNLDGRQTHKVVEKGKVRWVLDPKPDGHNVRDLFHAIIVARTPRHARLLGGRKVAESLEASALAYTQHPKTRITASWIPWGAEHLATPQEIADVICGTLLEVNFHQLARNPAEFETMISYLSHDFELMTDLINGARGTKYSYPVLTMSVDDLSPAMRPGHAGWPRFSKDKQGVWTIVNPGDVEKARANREAWAAKRRGE